MDAYLKDGGIVIDAGMRISASGGRLVNVYMHNKAEDMMCSAEH